MSPGVELCLKNQDAKPMDKTFKEVYFWVCRNEGDIGTFRDIIGLSERSIRRKCKENGLSTIPLRRRIETKEHQFEEAYNHILGKDGTTEDLARLLDCTDSYVRILYKKFKVTPLRSSDRKRGGKRTGAGRPKGSKNKDPAMIEQYFDNKTNSIEVGISSTVRVTKRDWWQYTQSLRAKQKIKV